MFIPVSGVKWKRERERERERESLSVIAYTNHVNSPEVWALNTGSHQIDSTPVPCCISTKNTPKEITKSEDDWYILSVTPVGLSNWLYTQEGLYLFSHCFVLKQSIRI